LRRFVAFPYKLLNVADVIIMHSVEKSLIYVQFSTLAWAACGKMDKWLVLKAVELKFYGKLP